MVGDHDAGELHLQCGSDIARVHQPLGNEGQRRDVAHPGDVPPRKRRIKFSAGDRMNWIVEIDSVAAREIRGRDLPRQAEAVANVAVPLARYWASEAHHDRLEAGPFGASDKL